MSVPSHYLVIIPGFMGSKLRDKETGEFVWVNLSSLPPNPFEWEVWLDRMLTRLKYPNDALEAVDVMDEVIFVSPWAKQEHYVRLLEMLEGMGYKVNPTKYSEQERNVYSFPYDWRQDNRKSAVQLGEAIEHWNSYHPGAKAWIIAHSNGGLVARWYIEKLGGKERVERLFLMGSPWDGTPKAMVVLTDGLDTLFRRRFNIFDIPQQTREVMRTFPCAYQLIPTNSQFLRDSYGKMVDPFTNSLWLDTQKEKQYLSDALSFNQELGKTSSIETICFFGRKNSTTSGGIVSFGAGDVWKKIEWEKIELGDGTVPEHSAVFPEAKSSYPFSASHGDIYVNSAVLDVLEWELFGKFHVAKRAILVNERIAVISQMERDAYKPGEWIPIHFLVNESKDDRRPISGAQVRFQMVWRQPLPGNRNRFSARIPLGVALTESKEVPGSYHGSIEAPLDEGYYEIRTAVTIRGQSPVLLSEMVIVEAVE